MQFHRAAEGSVSQPGFECLSLGEAVQPLSDINKPFVDKTYSDFQHSCSLKDAQQTTQAGDGLPMQFHGAAEGSVSQPGVEHHSPGAAAQPLLGVDRPFVDETCEH